MMEHRLTTARSLIHKLDIETFWDRLSQNVSHNLCETLATRRCQCLPTVVGVLEQR